MITLTEQARQELEMYFDGQARTPIRIYLQHGGCGGPRLGLALDTPGEDDVTLEVDGFTFCLNEKLQTSIGGAGIELTPFGFLVTPDIPLPRPAGGGCGSCCGACGSASACEGGNA